MSICFSLRWQIFINRNHHLSDRRSNLLRAGVTKTKIARREKKPDSLHRTEELCYDISHYLLSYSAGVNNYVY